MFLLLVAARVFFYTYCGGHERARKAVQKISSTMKKPELAGD
jgi:hypothetical protein